MAGMGGVTNRLTGAEAFVRMLRLHGVDHVFGLCGDTSLPLYDALYRLDHGIRHVLTRDERSAAYMADGPTLVDVVTQPLEEARAPVSEWVA